MKCASCGKEMLRSDRGFYVCPDSLCQLKAEQAFAVLMRLRRLEEFGFK